MICSDLLASLGSLVTSCGCCSYVTLLRSMVNCMTLNPTSRVVLASCRNAFTMYRWIAYSSIFVGCCFVCIFHLGTKEPRLKYGFPRNHCERIEWAYWFGKVLYYQVSLVYVLTRVVTNVSQAFLAFYVINELQMAQSSKALAQYYYDLELELLTKLVLHQRPHGMH